MLIKVLPELPSCLRPSYLERLRTLRICATRSWLDWIALVNPRGAPLAYGFLSQGGTANAAPFGRTMSTYKPTLQASTTGVEIMPGLNPIGGRIEQQALEEKLGIRQLYQRFAGARGQRALIGIGARIADEMARWFRSTAWTGSWCSRRTCQAAWPTSSNWRSRELRECGLFRTEYAGSALRDRLGLPRSVSRWQTAPRRSAPAQTSN